MIRAATVVCTVCAGWCLSFAQSNVPASPPACREPLNLSSTQTILSKAESGDHAAECMLGFAYHYGIGVKQTDVEAAKWLRRSAESGAPLAEDELGYLYEHGRGVPQDEATAAKWYAAAASQGLAVAQNNLGYMYYTGRGIQGQNYQEAAKWFGRA